LFLNCLLAMFFLVYLCALDIVFIFVMDEEVSVLNDLGFLIVLMPFLGLIFTVFLTSKWESLKMRILAGAVAFFVLVVVGYMEYLWVATHFHSMMGGKI